MEKILKLNGQGMRMVANARVPRTYRNMFGSDMFIDMQELTKGYNNRIKDGTNLPPKVLTIFENVAWIFLKEGGENVGSNPDEWLENLDSMFSIYEVLPQIVELWHDSNKTTSTPSDKK